MADVRWSCVPMIFFNDLLRGRMDLPHLFDTVTGLGLEGVELHTALLGDLGEDKARFIQSQLSQRGLCCSMVVAAPDFSHPVPEKRRGEVEKFKRAIDFSGRVGCRRVRVTAGQRHPGLDEALGLESVVDCFEEALAYARGKDLALAFENHYKNFFWEYPDFAMEDRIYLPIVERMRGAGLKVNYDSSNCIMGGYDGVELLRSVVDLVVNVHLSDRKSSGGYRHDVIGEGDIDFPAIFRVLKARDYSGFMSIEYNGTEGLDGLRRSFAQARRLWAETLG